MLKITSTTILTEKSGSWGVKAPQKPPFQLLIIDAKVKDYAPLINALEPDISVAFLNNNGDGVQQLSDILSKYKNLKALHIVAHGSSGTLNLGNTSLNLNNIDDYAPQLQIWRKALRENADLFLYSCEIAADGGAFLSRLHQELGVNVAGSRQKVGNPELGGTWNLDVILGKIRSQFPFNREKIAAYSGVLATYTVAAGDVAGLKKAIADANATLADDTIELAAGTYNLTTVDNNTSDGFASATNGLPTPADLTVGGKLTINGNGAIIQRDAAAPAFRFFYVPSNTDLTLNNLTFSNGLADKRGGAIYVTSTLGNLTVNNSTFTNNKVTGNGGYGGGAICIYYNSTATINNSTFSGNIADDSGGAIHNIGTLNVTNSTFTNNIADNDVSNNTTYDAGGAIFQNSGTATLKNTLIAGNSDLSTNIKNPDLAGGTWTDGGGNLIGDNTGVATTFPAGPLVGTASAPLDPKLGPLQDNGGLSFTHALLSGSPAIDKGNNANATGLTYDQRGTGFPRIVNTTVDIGAFEVSPAATITKVLVPPALTYKAGDNLDFVVYFSQPVTVKKGTGNVTLPLTLNTGGKVNATLVGTGAASTFQIFRYNIAQGNFDNDGLVLDPSLVLTGDATIKDASSNTVGLGLINVGDTTKVNVDAIPPTITSVTRQNPTTPSTNGNSVVYQVNFSEAVKNLDLTDFVLNKTGTVNGNIASVSATTGTTVTVTVNGITGEGDLRLDTSATPTIQDNAGNNFTTLFNTGEIYTFDKTPPTITKITRQNPTTQTTTANSVVYQVDFSEAVQGLDVSDFALTPTGTAKGNIASVSATTGNSVTVTVDGITGAGDLRLDTSATPTIQDNAGNSLTTVFTTGESYTFQPATTTPTTTSTTTTTISQAPQNITVEIPILNNDKERPQVEVRPAANQSQNFPLNADTKINFTVTFSKSVTGFGPEDLIVLSNNQEVQPGDVKTEVTGSGTTYNVAISNIKKNGDFELKIKDKAAKDGSNNESLASDASDVNQIIRFTVQVGNSSLFDQVGNDQIANDQIFSGNPGNLSTEISNSEKVMKLIEDGLIPLYSPNQAQLISFYLNGPTVEPLPFEQTIDFPDSTNPQQEITLSPDMGAEVSYNTIETSRSASAQTISPANSSTPEQITTWPSGFTITSSSGTINDSQRTITVTDPSSSKIQSIKTDLPVSFSNIAPVSRNLRSQSDTSGLATQQNSQTISIKKVNNASQPDHLEWAILDSSSLPNATFQLENMDGVIAQGDMTVLGGTAPDFVVGQKKSQTMVLGPGADNARGGPGDDSLFGGKDNDLLDGNEGNDYLSGEMGDDTLFGGKGNDSLDGGEGKDFLDGGKGEDTLLGGLGDDTLFGGEGNDSLNGGKGKDFLYGGKGGDTLTGGLGDDTFVIQANDPPETSLDIITDFTVGKDSLGLTKGLTFTDLTIVNGTGEQAGNTLIQNTKTQQWLVFLKGVSANTITANSFVTIKPEMLL
jgi:hypothetical protein